MTTDDKSGNEVKNNSMTARTDRETYNGILGSTQTFGGIGILEAVCGDVVLRGRNGQRDHLYPLERALSRYYETKRMVSRMARHGVRGWDTLMDIAEEMQARILEACRQRRELNREIPQAVQEFEQQCSASAGNAGPKPNTL